MSNQIVDGAYSLALLPTQRVLFDAVASLLYPNTMYCGGFGCGKSRIGGEIGWQMGLNIPGLEVGFWRKTRTSLVDTTYRIFMEEVLPEEYIRSHNQSKLTLYLQNGSRFDFLGMDRVTRKGSYWFDVCILDESIEFEESELKMIEGRLRGKHLRVPMLIYLTNPGAPGSYQHRIFPANEALPAAERNRFYKYISTTSFENVHNPPAYFERLKQWKGTQYYDRYVMSMWKAFAGMVYENWDPDGMVVDPFVIPNEWPRYLSIDFGYDHPLVMLWIAEEPRSGIKFVYRQMYMSHVLCRKAIETAKNVTEQCGEKLVEIHADHDAENRAQVDNDWRATKPARKEVAAGIQSVQETMFRGPDGKYGLYIFNDTWAERDGFWYGVLERDKRLQEMNKPTSLQDEMPLYKWGPGDAPVKVDDHGQDALRYHIHSVNTQRRRKRGPVRLGEGQPARR